jgi:hypothetical protein
MKMTPPRMAKPHRRRCRARPREPEQGVEQGLKVLKRAWARPIRFNKVAPDFLESN